MQALALAGPPHGATAIAPRGRRDGASVADVKALYEELSLRARVEVYERDSHARLTALIADAGDAAAAAARGERACRARIPSADYEALLEDIYNRER